MVPLRSLVLVFALLLAGCDQVISPAPETGKVHEQGPNDEAPYLGEGMELGAPHGSASLVSSTMLGTTTVQSGSVANIKDGNTATYHRFHAEEIDAFSPLTVDATWEISLDARWWVDTVRVYMNGFKLAEMAGTYEGIEYTITVFDSSGAQLVAESGTIYSSTSYIDVAVNKFAKRVLIRIYKITGGGGRAGNIIVEATLYEVYVYGEEWVASNLFARMPSGTKRIVKHLSSSGGWLWDGSKIVNPVLVATSHYLASAWRVQAPSGLKSVAIYK